MERTTSWSERVAKEICVELGHKPIDYAIYRTNVLIGTKNNRDLLLYLNGANPKVKEAYQDLFNRIDDVIKLEASLIASL